MSDTLLFDWGEQPTTASAPGVPQSNGPIRMYVPNIPQYPVIPNAVTLSSRDIGNAYYQNSAVYDRNDVKLYTDDEEIKKIALDSVDIPSGRFYKDFKGFRFTIFVTRNGAYLMDQHKKCEPDDKEIVVFLEIDDSTNLFGSVMLIKSGTNTGNINLPFSEMLAFARSKRVNLPSSDIVELIKSGTFKAKDSLAERLVNLVRNALGFIADFPREAAAKVNVGVIIFFEKLLIEDQSWNSEIEGYDALFTPDIKDILKKSGKLIDDVESGVMDMLEVLKTALPTSLYNKISKYLRKMIRGMDNFLNDLKESEIVSFFEGSLEMLNAYLCGLINSVIDFVKGIFEMIGILLSIIGTAKELRDDAFYYLSLVGEMFENLISMIADFDMGKFLKESFNATVEMAKKVYAFLKDPNISINIPDFTLNVSKIGYICGYAIGLAATIIIDALLTGGTKAVADLVKALANFVKKPGAILRETLGQTFRTIKETMNLIVEKIISFMSEMATSLKNGGKKLIADFRKFVDDVLKWLEEWFVVKNVDETKKLQYPIKNIIGKYCKRRFDVNNCGGKILKLKWENANISDEGIDLIKRHLSRFDKIEANRKMIERLQNIRNGNLEITDWDKRYYTHELREYERYKNFIIYHRMTHALWTISNGRMKWLKIQKKGLIIRPKKYTTQFTIDTFIYLPILIVPNYLKAKELKPAPETSMSINRCMGEKDHT